MEQIFRLLIFSLFLVLFNGYATGAKKKKKDLETIVEVGPWNHEIVHCVFFMLFSDLIAIHVRLDSYFGYLLFARLCHPWGTSKSLWRGFCTVLLSKYSASRFSGEREIKNTPMYQSDITFIQSVLSFM